MTEEIQEEIETDKSAMEEAEEVLTKLRSENERLEKNLEKAEKMESERILTGKSFAGVPNKSKEEIAIDNARESIAGSGFEDELFPRT